MASDPPCKVKMSEPRRYRKRLRLINNIGDIVVFIGFKGVNSDKFFMFSGCYSNPQVTL